jgi:predicted DNA-binding antitoxin AbrB/MazE fold protein
LTVRHEGERVRVLVVSEDVTERLRAVSALRLQGDVEVVEAISGDEARDLLLVD